MSKIDLDPDFLLPNDRDFSRTFWLDMAAILGVAAFAAYWAIYGLLVFLDWFPVMMGWRSPYA